MIDPRHDPLPETELGRASATRTVPDGDLIEPFFAEPQASKQVFVAHEDEGEGAALPAYQP